MSNAQQALVTADGLEIKAVAYLSGTPKLLRELATEITDLRTALAERDAEIDQRKHEKAVLDRAYTAQSAEIATLRAAAQQGLEWFEAYKANAMSRNNAENLALEAITAVTAALESKT